MRSGSIFFITFFMALSISLMAQSSKKMTRADYTEEYKDIAIMEMKRTGVPASITLAQGMLESDDGNSSLAVKAKNHFGIKCHDDWKGKKIYHDDDQRKECFRKYNSVYESYEDHSDFLRTGSRYSFLFELDPVDYKSWAKGLKKAGYATNQEYAEKLIEIIDENDLHQYDLIGSSGKKTSETRKIRGQKFSETKEPTREIFKRNLIKYIVIQEGDTYQSLQKELGLLPFEIFKYNDLSRDSLLYPGREIYLQPKRLKAASGASFHIVKQGETMYAISQMYGVKLSRLYKMNLMNPGTEPTPDQKISLRKKLKGIETMTRSQKEAPVQKNPVPKKLKEAETKPPKEIINPDKDKEDKIQFEFK
jgi:LysM repeat protein